MPVHWLTARFFNGCASWQPFDLCTARWRELVSPHGLPVPLPPPAALRPAPLPPALHAFACAHLCSGPRAPHPARDSNRGTPTVLSSWPLPSNNAFSPNELRFEVHPNDFLLRVTKLYRGAKKDAKSVKYFRYFAFALGPTAKKCKKCKIR